MTAEVILYSGWLTPALCARNPENWFVYGDNLLREGKGGQAVIRDCPNAVGVATKRAPHMAPNAFFKEGNDDDLQAVASDLDLIWLYLESGKTVVIPVTNDLQPSLGLERAELPKRAPSIYEMICEDVAEMCRVYPSRYTDVL